MGPPRIEQAIMILIDYALKYGVTSRGGNDTVSLSSTDEGATLRVEVADRGPGIPDEELDRIFERFYRLDKARSRKLGGAGLGLPIARPIVEAHGGKIEARSTVGQGTTVAMILLATPNDEAPDAPSRTERAGIGSP